MQVGGRMKLCEACQENQKTVTSDGLCRECEMFMCNKCFKDHLQWKFNKQHVLVDATNPNVRTDQNVEICSQHGETIKFYCSKDIAVGCAECIVLKHKTCQVQYIKDLAKDFKSKNEFGGIVKEVKQIKAVTDENSKLILEAHQKFKRNISKVRKEIKAFREQMKEFLERAEKNILSDLAQREKQNESLLKDLEKENTALQTELHNMEHLLNTEVYTDHGLFINTLEVKSKIPGVKAAIDDIKVKTGINSLAFTPDEDLRKQCQKISLGKFQTMTPPKFCICSLSEVRTKPIQLFIDGVGNFTLQVKRGFTVKKVKEMLQEKTGIPFGKQTLKIKFTGKVLRNELTLADYDIQDQTSLKLEMKLDDPNQKQTKDT